ncbi:hypothetical protein K5E_06370 [Enterococcus thailandicus]|uniref:Uncharacterized protein n=1 Tax=Enterococcus thailandicus TaxID=417368 RepID=A0A510WFF8_ENTTH|nr:MULTISPECIES: hypothetical protein [Enterococcus]MDA3964052.1 hypothetical protein [Enterococcus thailandicus]MDT2752854.1 hypothetical protein [Enterococcus thailandicus]MDT2774881.1 hypothetical protein [Enterococcus thailandicus]MDT2846059.1 hypothetical protein [Enterococcus thailandicus]OTP23764.1 hypothetical protein A5800_001621 [Enterococcus sp. 5B7_DIV0075]
MFRKIDQILKKSPFYRMIAVVSLVAIGESFLNLFNHRFLFSNMQTTYTFLFLYGAMLLLSKLSLPKWLLFILVYLIFFTIASVEMFLDHSYVDYTSFIVVGGVTLLVATIVTIGAVEIKRRGYR